MNIKLPLSYLCLLLICTAFLHSAVKHKNPPQRSCPIDSAYNSPENSPHTTPEILRRTHSGSSQNSLINKNPVIQGSTINIKQAIIVPSKNEPIYVEINAPNQDELTRYESLKEELNILKNDRCQLEKTKSRASITTDVKTKITDSDIPRENTAPTIIVNNEPIFDSPHTITTKPQNSQALIITSVEPTYLDPSEINMPIKTQEKRVTLSDFVQAVQTKGPTIPPRRGISAPHINTQQTTLRPTHRTLWEKIKNIFSTK